LRLDRPSHGTRQPPGGAALVIALAAVVALPDLQAAIEALYKVAHPDPEP
jgi:hypothetical protein